MSREKEAVLYEAPDGQRFDTAWGAVEHHLESEYPWELAVREGEIDRVIYYVGPRRVDAPIKIGFTLGNLQNRITALQCGNPEKLVPIAWQEYDRRLEERLHKQFAEYRMMGEWFQRSPAILEHIEQIHSSEAWSCFRYRRMPWPKRIYKDA